MRVRIGDRIELCKQIRHIYQDEYLYLVTMSGETYNVNCKTSENAVQLYAQVFVDGYVDLTLYTYYKGLNEGQIMDITRVAYEKYKLQWMINHGYTLTDLVKELNIMQKENPDDKVSQLFDDWEFGYGFGSEIWACYDEFMENEFQNPYYMCQILTCSEFDAYVEYISRSV